MSVWPLVGRDHELAALRQVLVDDGRSAVVAAPAGTGKTRLVGALLGELDRGAVPIPVLARVTGTRAARTVPLAAVATLLPLDAPEAAAPLDLIRAVRRHVTEQRGDARAVIAVDDAHLLDPLSATLLHSLVTSDGVQVIAALRTGEPVEDAVTALWRDGAAERIDLQPLGLDELRALLREVLGADIDSASAWRLWKLTGGNPLYAHEVVEGSLQSGALRNEGGVWRWDGDTSVSARLRELRHDRLDTLSPDERELVDLLALADRVDDGVVIAAGLTAPVERMLRVGFVVEEHRGATRQLALDHPLFAEVVRSSMSAHDRTKWCRVLAQGAVSPANDDTSRLQRAVWLLDAHTEPDPELLIDAAEVATARFDGELGARLAVAAVAAGGGIRAALAQAEALILGANYDAALACAPEIDGDRAWNDDLRARLASMHAEANFWGLGRAEATDATLADIAQRMTTSAGRERVQALASAVLFAANQVAAAGELALPIATNPDADPRARLRASTAAAGRQARAGYPKAAYELCEALLPVGLMDAERFPRGVGWVLAQMLVALNCEGRFDEITALVTPVRDSAIVDGDDEVVNAATLVLARMAFNRGDLLEAAALVREIAPALREYDPAGYLPWCLGLTAQVAAHCGDLATADSAVAALDELERRGAWVVHINDHEVVSGRAWTAAAHGELVAPAEWLVEAAAEAEAGGERQISGVLLYDALRLGAAAAPMIPALERSCETGELPINEIFLAHARARADDEGAALDVVAANLEQAGLYLMAADAANEAASAHRRASTPSRAARSAQHAARLYAQCPGARRQHDVAVERAQLTRREREIVRLAADGLSNQLIADTLHVNVRTVEGHLLRATAKLGVHRRSELGAALDTLGG